MKNIYIFLTALLAGSTCFGQLQKANTVSRAISSTTSLPEFIDRNFDPLKVSFDTSIKRYGEGSQANDYAEHEISLQAKISDVSSQKGQIQQLLEEQENAKGKINSQIEDISSIISSTENEIKKKSDSLKKAIVSDSVSDRLKETIKALNDELNKKNSSLQKLNRALVDAKTSISKLKNASLDLTEQLQVLRQSKEENEKKFREIILNNTTEITRLAKQSREDKYLLYKVDSANYANLLNQLMDSLNVKQTLLTRHKDSLSLKKFSYSGVVVDSESVVNALSYLNSLSGNVSKTQAFLDLILKPEIDPLNKSIIEFSKISILFSYTEIPYSKLIDSILKPRAETVNKQITELMKKIKEFSEYYRAYADEFNLIIAKFYSAFRTKAEEQNNDVSVLGKITSPLNESGLFVPGFDVLAYRKFSDENVAIFGQAKFFVASSKSDTNKLNNGTRIFVPEASTLGFMVDFTFGFDLVEYKPKKSLLPKRYHSLGVNASLYYLQKQLNTGDKENLPFSIGMVQTRIGLEKTIVRNGLAVFVNLNGFFVGRGLDKYQQFYDNTTKMNWYVETGLKSYLKLTKDEKTNISFELRFIPVNPTVRKITQSSDKFIPLINVGVVRDFNF